MPFTHPFYHAVHHAFYHRSVLNPTLAIGFDLQAIAFIYFFKAIADLKNVRITYC